MTYRETMAVVYRIIGAYPFYARQFTDEMIEEMIREWHEGLSGMASDRVMEAVTMLITEQKWMPSLSEVIAKILDVQYGTDGDIIRALDRAIAGSSTCIIFGQVTAEQTQGFNKLSRFQKLIVKSPAEFNQWLMKDYEWKEERVKLIKRQIQYGRHRDYLSGKQPDLIENGFDIFKALEERKRSGDTNGDKTSK